MHQNTQIQSKLIPVSHTCTHTSIHTQLTSLIIMAQALRNYEGSAGLYYIVIKDKDG